MRHAALFLALFIGQTDQIVPEVQNRNSGASVIRPVKPSELNPAPSLLNKNRQQVQTINGSQATNGQDGKAATIKIGKTITVAPDEPARVVNSGTATDAVLEFDLPQGEPGGAGSDVDVGALRAEIAKLRADLVLLRGMFDTFSAKEPTNGKDGKTPTSEELLVLIREVMPKPSGINYDVVITQLLMRLPPLKVQSYNQLVGSDGKLIGEPKLVDEEAYPYPGPIKIRHLIPQPAR